MTDDADIRSREICHGWEHNRLGVKPSLDVVSMDDLRKKLVTGSKVQPQVARAHARRSVYVLGTIN